MEDTPDKVSAESLSAVGRLVELGLRTRAFVDIAEDNNSEEETPEDPTPEEVDDEDEQQGSKTLALLAALGLFAILGLIFVVEWKGKP